MVHLKVRKSAVPGEGIARVHINVLNALGIKPGDNIVVRYGAKAIIVTAFGDNLVGEEDIRLRAKDMARLGVRKGDTVEVTPYEPLILKKRSGHRGLMGRLRNRVHNHNSGRS